MLMNHCVIPLNVTSRVFPLGAVALHSSVGWCQVVGLCADNAHLRVVEYEIMQHPTGFALACESRVYTTRVNIADLTRVHPAEDFAEHVPKRGQVLPFRRPACVEICI
jgi:hypothetical protein